MRLPFRHTGIFVPDFRKSFGWGQAADLWIVDCGFAMGVVFQRRNGLLLLAYKTGVGLLDERRGSILKKGFLPLIEEGRVDLVLFIHLGELR